MRRGFIVSVFFLVFGISNAQDTISDSKLDSLIDRTKKFLVEFIDFAALDHSLQARSASKAAVKDRLNQYYEKSGIDFTTLSNLSIDEFWPRTINRRHVFSIVKGKLDTVVFDNNESYSVNIHYRFLPNADSTSYSVLFKGRVNQKLIDYLNVKDITIDLQKVVDDYLKKQPLIYNQYHEPKDSKNDILAVLDALFQKVLAVTQPYANELLQLQELLDDANDIFPLASSGFNVQFYPHPDQKYGLDNYESSYQQWQGDYQKIIMGVDNTPYLVGNKSLESTSHDKVIAKLFNADRPDITCSKIRFIDSKFNEISIESVDSTTNTFVLDIPPHHGKSKIYAYFDGNNPIGKLKLKNYSPKSKRVVVVPVCSGVNSSSSSLETQLDSVYQQAVVSWKVDLKPSFSISRFFNSTFSDPDVTGMIKYTEGMKQLRDEYLSFDTSVNRQSYLIFIVDGFSDPSLNGYMVRGRGLGFITRKAINDPKSKTLAHELAHGAFGLKHTFDEIPKGTTNNLLDNAATVSNSKLVKSQWDQIHNPLPIISWLDGEEDGQFMMVYAIDKARRIVEKIRCGYVQNQNIDIDLEGPLLSVSNDALTNGVEFAELLFSTIPRNYGEAYSTLKFTPTNHSQPTFNAPKTTVVYNGSAGKKLQVKVNEYSNFTGNTEAYLFPSQSEFETQQSNRVANIVSQLNQDNDVDKDELYALLDCGVDKLSFENKMKIVGIILSELVNNVECDEEIILGLLQSIPSSEGAKFLSYLNDNPSFTANLFQSVDQFEALTALVTSHWVNTSTFSSPDHYQYQDVIGGGITGAYSSSPAVMYDGDLFFKTVDWNYIKIESPGIVMVGKAGSQKHERRWEMFQPVLLLNEDNNKVAYVPALIAAMMIHEEKVDGCLTRLSLMADVVLTFSAVGNLAKIQHLSGAVKLSRVVVAGLEVTTSVADILLNYTDLCQGNVSQDFCDALRQYNFYLQMTMLGGEILNATGRQTVNGYYEKLTDEYITSRNQLKQNLQNNEIDELDGFFGIVRNVDEIKDLLKTQPNTAFFWSGMTNGVGGEKVALNIALSQGGTTLEGIIKQHGINIPTWDAGDDLVTKLWNDISEEYAKQVKGQVRAVIGQDLRNGNIWETKELPALKSNENVTKISIIDPVSLLETVIFNK